MKKNEKNEEDGGCDFTFWVGWMVRAWNHVSGDEVFVAHESLQRGTR